MGRDREGDEWGTEIGRGTAVRTEQSYRHRAGGMDLIDPRLVKLPTEIPAEHRKTHNKKAIRRGVIAEGCWKRKTMINDIKQNRKWLEGGEGDLLDAGRPTAIANSDCNPLPSEIQWFVTGVRSNSDRHKVDRLQMFIYFVFVHIFQYGDNFHHKIWYFPKK